MELVHEPDIYSPNIDDLGNYIDSIPSFHVMKKGVRCPCGSRKDKVYETQPIFSAHVKTKTHQKWLATLNQNKANYYVENETLKDTIQTQRIIIAKLEKDLNMKTMTIDYLTSQLVKTNTPSISNKPTPENCNLLDFD
jgi:hypothetical protein